VPMSEGSCGVWLVKCCQGPKTNKSNFWSHEKLIFDWLIDNPLNVIKGLKRTNRIVSLIRS
jgi:hypothetical protein